MASLRRGRCTSLALALLRISHQSGVKNDRKTLTKGCSLAIHLAEARTQQPQAAQELDLLAIEQRSRHERKSRQM